MRLWALDAAVGIGVLLNFLKAGDLLLRPHQRRRIQDWAETFTLRLEELQPVLWFRHLESRRAHYFLLAFGATQFALGAYLFSRQSDIREPLSIAAQLASLGVFLVLLPKVIKWWTTDHVEWLVGDARAIGVLGRMLNVTYYAFVGAFAFGVATLLAIWALKRGAIPVREVENTAEYHFVVSLIWPALAYAFALYEIGYLIFVAILLLHIASGATKFARAIAWRVVEYDKGAYAALLVIVTAVFGMADIYLRVR